MRIREATPADAGPIAELQARSWRVTHADRLTEAEIDALVEGSVLPNLRWTLEHRPDYWRMWIAEDGGTVVGFASTSPSTDTDVRPSDRVGEVTAVYADPDRQGRGIGSALLAHAIADLAERTERVTLWVAEDNAAARGFFEARGWEADGATTVDLVGEVLLPVVRYRRAPEPAP